MAGLTYADRAGMASIVPKWNCLGKYVRDAAMLRRLVLRSKFDQFNPWLLPFLTAWVASDIRQIFYA
ncbi:hypothetical protein CXF92_00420 [Pseudomonas sp. Choline-3u-10]|nr:hypothetical protein CXF92_00420 [Pseudomonas sp. Choline-3u-10]